MATEKQVAFLVEHCAMTAEQAATLSVASASKVIGRKVRKWQRKPKRKSKPLPPFMPSKGGRAIQVSRFRR